MIAEAAIQEDVDAIALRRAHDALPGDPGRPARGGGDIPVFGGGIIPDEDRLALEQAGVASIHPRRERPGDRRLDQRQHPPRTV